MIAIELTDDKRVLLAHAVISFGMANPDIATALESDLNLSGETLKVCREDAQILLQAVEEYASQTAAMLGDAQRRLVVRQELEAELNVSVE